MLTWWRVDLYANTIHPVPVLRRLPRTLVLPSRGRGEPQRRVPIGRPYFESYALARADLIECRRVIVLEHEEAARNARAELGVAEALPLQPAGSVDSWRSDDSSEASP